MKITCVHAFLKLCIVITSKIVGKISCTFMTVITQITKFSLNLGTSNKSFKTTKFSLERCFQKE